MYYIFNIFFFLLYLSISLLLLLFIPVHTTIMINVVDPQELFHRFATWKILNDIIYYYLYIIIITYLAD